MARLRLLQAGAAGAAQPTAALPLTPCPPACPPCPPTPQVDLGEVYQGVERGRHVYRLRSMVCYYGQHYQARAARVWAPQGGGWAAAGWSAYRSVPPPARPYLPAPSRRCSDRCCTGPTPLLPAAPAPLQALVLVPEAGGWLVFDDTRVTRVGAWADVQRKCEAGRIQPSVLFYETDA